MLILMHISFLLPFKRATWVPNFAIISTTPSNLYLCSLDIAGASKDPYVVDTSHRDLPSVRCYAYIKFKNILFDYQNWLKLVEFSLEEFMETWEDEGHCGTLGCRGVVVGCVFEWNDLFPNKLMLNGDGQKWHLMIPMYIWNTNKY